MDPATVGLINTGISVVSQILGGGVDTMKHQTSCGLMLNSGQAEKLSKTSMAPLTTMFRTSVKRQVNGKSTNGRTWQECVLARTIFPGQVTGPMANPDMMDYLPGVADDRGMLKPAAQVQVAESPYVAVNPNTAAAAAGTSLKAVEKSIQEAVSGGDDLLKNPIVIGAALLAVAVVVMK